MSWSRRGKYITEFGALFPSDSVDNFDNKVLIVELSLCNDGRKIFSTGARGDFAES